MVKDNANIYTLINKKSNLIYYDQLVTDENKEVKQW